MAVAVYPGSFDPVTMGHLDIAQRASTLFEKVVVAVYETPSKSLMFTTEERVALIQAAVADLPNVEVNRFTGLLVECARTNGAQAIVRGLRSGSDFEYEFEMAYMNRTLAPDVEVVCLMARMPYQFISSSLLKEVASLGGDVRSLVPKEVLEALNRKMSQSGRTLG